MATSGGWFRKLGEVYRPWLPAWETEVKRLQFN